MKHWHYKDKKPVAHSHDGGNKWHQHRGLRCYGRERKTITCRGGGDGHGSSSSGYTTTTPGGGDTPSGRDIERTVARGAVTGGVRSSITRTLL